MVKHCHCITTSEEAIPLPELDSNIEEAGVIPHSLHAAKGMAKRIIILSNDTDVIVLGLHFLMF